MPASGPDVASVVFITCTLERTGMACRSAPTQPTEPTENRTATLALSALGYFLSKKVINSKTSTGKMAVPSQVFDYCVFGGSQVRNPCVCRSRVLSCLEFAVACFSSAAPAAMHAR